MENNNKEEDRKYYVYAHVRLDKMEPFYIGKGKGNRAYKLKRNYHHDRISKKYGHAVVIIADKLTEEEAYWLERDTIEDYVFNLGYGIDIEGHKDYDNELPHLTNMDWGGIGVFSGMHHSEETRTKIGEGNKGKNKGKIPWNKGKKGIYNHSEETRTKISEGNKGKKGKNAGKPASNRNKVVCITTCKIFNSVTDASNYYNIARTNISKCCIGRKQSAGKLQDGTKLRWKYLKDYDNDCKGILINPITKEVK